ncbi:hypothetical protein HIM_03432 [Hirsutella minnesotensis 3608]|uniref:RING-type E3 ubiquitin transferase n=1 Tax=Hirsutella minnesotensis 3608 TaxID=1043627 RepID=A0A0F7ZMB1_9HYPO|nr:hypothetical protein HIM_03432 [Hirsutella minnesotensis 3608]
MEMGSPVQVPVLLRPTKPQPCPESHDDRENHVAAPEPAQEECVICLDGLTERCEALPCGHSNFHLDCVASWLLQTLRHPCPICRRVVDCVVYGQEIIWYHHPAAPSTTTLPPHAPQRTLAQAPSNRNPHLIAARGRRRRRVQRPRPRDEPAGLETRRQVYRLRQYSMHVGSNPRSRYRELTRDDFVGSADLQRRARLFLRRELQVFGWLAVAEVDGPDPARTSTPPAQRPRPTVTLERMVNHIVMLLHHAGIRSSDGLIENDLTRHLGRENANQLLHELNSFLRSPFATLEEWDRHVQYHHPSRPQIAIVDGPRDRRRAPGSRSESGYLNEPDRQRLALAVSELVCVGSANTERRS